MIDLSSLEEDFVSQSKQPKKEDEMENVKLEAPGDNEDNKKPLEYAENNAARVNIKKDDEKGRTLNIGGKSYSLHCKSSGSDVKCAEFKIHICTTCGKAFKNIRSMKLHETGHSGEKLHHCDTCGKPFTTKHGLKTHILTHTGEKAYTCVTCGKSFTQASSLKTHEVTHTGERAYTCVECGKSFKQASHLKTHSVSHSGEKIHTCKVCGRSFGLASQMRRHEQLHLTKPHIQERNMDGDKPFSCKTCGKGFSQAGNLRRHEQHTHAPGSVQQRWAQNLLTSNKLLNIAHQQNPDIAQNTSSALTNAWYNEELAAHWSSQSGQVPPLWQFMLSQEGYRQDQSVGPFRPFTATSSPTKADSVTDDVGDVSQSVENEESSSRGSTPKSRYKDESEKEEVSDKDDTFEDSLESVDESEVNSGSEDVKVEVKLEAESSSDEEDDNDYSNADEISHSNDYNSNVNEDNNSFSNEGDTEYRVPSTKDEVIEHPPTEEEGSKVMFEMKEEPDETLSCPLCFKAFSKYRHVLQHLVRLHKLDPPAAKTLFPPEVTKHEDTDQTRISPCPLCGKRFKHMAMVRQHLRRIHKLDPSAAKKLTSDDEKMSDALTKEFVVKTSTPCGQCGQIFQGPYGLNKHIALYHTFGDFTCEHCGEKFDLKGKLKSHIFKLHSANGSKVCHICAKTVKNLKSHVRDVHTREDDQMKEDFTCPQCDKIFKNKKYLTSHISTAHSDESKAMVCPYCSKECKNKAYYNKHVQRVHGTEENVKCEECEECGKVFPNKAYLRTHINTVHVVDTRYCEICGRSCKNKMTLNNHMKNTHYNVPGAVENTNNPCGYCGQIFLDQKRLKKHIGLNHVIGDYMCKKCGEHFEFKVKLKGHQRSAHKTTVNWQMHALL